jgi:hypothetical protein
MKKKCLLRIDSWKSFLCVFNVGCYDRILDMSSGCHSIDGFLNGLNNYQHIKYLYRYYHWKFEGSISDDVIRFFNLPNPSSRTMALGSTQPLTEMSTRNLPGGKGGPALKADNLTAIYEPIV